VPLHFPAQGDSSKCQESCSMWLLESHQQWSSLANIAGLSDGASIPDTISRF